MQLTKPIEPKDTIKETMQEVKVLLPREYTHEFKVLSESAHHYGLQIKSLDDIFAEHLHKVLVIPPFLASPKSRG
jgi:hypothetical protein